MKRLGVLGSSCVLVLSNAGWNPVYSQIPILDPGYYKITAKHSDKSLDVERASLWAGTQVTQYTYHGGQNQVWRLEYLPGENAYLMIPKHTDKPLFTKMCLDIDWGSTATGAATIQNTVDSARNRNSQKWQIEVVDPQSQQYKITNVKSGKSLEVENGNQANLAWIQQVPYTGQDHQQWHFVKAIAEDEHPAVRILDNLLENSQETWQQIGSALWGLTMEGRSDPFTAFYSTMGGNPWKSPGAEAFEEDVDRKYAEMDFVRSPEDTWALTISNVVPVIWMTRPDWFKMLTPEVQKQLSILVHQKASVDGPYGWNLEDVKEQYRNNYNIGNFTNEAWFYTNGIAIDQKAAEKNGIMLANTFGRPITVIHNPTDGILDDLLECGITRLGGPIDHTPVIRDTLLAALQDPTKTKVVYMAHSGGTIQTAYVLKELVEMGKNKDVDAAHKLTPAEWSKLEVYNFATCATEYNIEGLPESVQIEHIENGMDPVSWLAGLATSPKAKRTGKTYINKGKWGHLFNMYYLEELNDYNADTNVNVRYTEHELATVHTIWGPKKVWQEVHNGPISKLYGYMYGRNPH